MANLESGPLALPQFETLRELIARNMGYFPKISYDRTGAAGHRVRIYRDPPGVDVLYSERALARYIELADLIFIAKQHNSARVLAAGLFAIIGGDLIRKNKFAGLAFIARGFQEANIQKPPHEKVLLIAQEAAARNDVIPLINLFLPLAHEIGHVPEAQAFCPRAILSDAIHETYKSNYNRVLGFTGNFDYADSKSDPVSPLNLSILREEAASDFFAAIAICWLIYRLLKPGDFYPLDTIAAGLFIFPLVMGLEAICLKDARSIRQLQEITLAMQCRYSLMIDSVRGSAKLIFSERKNFSDIELGIDKSIDSTVEYFDSLYRTAWEAFLIYSKEAEPLVGLDQPQVLKFVGEAVRDIRKRLAIADYLEILSKDVHGYPISLENLHNLRGYATTLRTFDTVITDGENALFL